MNPEYSLEGLMLKLEPQYFGYLMRRPDSLEKTMMLGKLRAGGEGDDRGRDGWMISLDLKTCLSKLWEMVKDREGWRAAVQGLAKSRTCLSD